MKAFPEIKYVAPQGMGGHVMAFEGGMDLRDYFAAKAMQGLLASDMRARTEQFVAKAYEIADAMVKARKV